MRILTLLGLLVLSFNAGATPLEGNWVWRKVALPPAEGEAPAPEEWKPLSPGNLRADSFSLARQLEETGAARPLTPLGFSASQDVELGLVFKVPEPHRSRRHVELHFAHLDTFAEIYLDGKLLLEAGNAFRSWVTTLGPGESPDRQLLIRLSATRGEARRRESLLPRAAIGGERVVTRRPQLGFGGQVCPEALDLSTSYPRLVSWDVAVVRSDAVIMTSAPVLKRAEGQTRCLKAELSLSLEVDAGEGTEATLSLTCREAVAEAKINLKPGRNSLTLPFALANPPLWWPRGLGGQEMPVASWELRLPSETIKGERAFGIRDLRLQRKTDDRGETFAFEVNGTALPIRGAHLLPANALQPLRADVAAVSAARDAGLNLLRIWAGGSYATDELMRACDAQGILIWQDLPFLDGLYPLEGEALTDVRAEVSEHVLRLRRHPSLALWCGITGAAEGWGEADWVARLGTPRAVADARARQREVFGKLIPGWIAAVDPGRPYLSESPRLSWRREPSYRLGDLWYKGLDEAVESLETAQSRVGRFVSGHGTLSHPSPAVIATWSGQAPGKAVQDTFLLQGARSAEVLAHRLGQEGLRPEGDTARAFATRWMQAEATRLLVAAHRADPACGGSIIWHLNDCWPTASASLLDFTGAAKPAYFAARQAFADDTVRLWFEGDNAYAQSVGKPHGTLLRLMDAGGRVLREVRSQGSATANMGKLVPGEASYVLAESGPHRLIRPLPPAFRGSDPRLGKVSFRTKASRATNAAFGFSEVTIEADTVIVGLCLEPILPGARATDGLIDLLPGEKHVISVRLEELRDWRANFRILTWHDLGVVPVTLGPEPEAR